MIYRTVLFALLGSALLLSKCGVEELENSQLLPPEVLEFPDCDLVSEDFIASYGISESFRREFVDGRLVLQTFNYNNQPNSTKEFVYDAQELPVLMLSVNTSGVDTLATYAYDVDQLVEYRHLRPSDSAVLDARRYTYQNGHLSQVGISDDFGRDLQIDLGTDKRGNPISLSYEVEGKSIEVRYEYDENPNPYYKMPDFIEESRYFAQNNLIRTITFENGEEVFTGFKTYAYFDNGLPSRITEVFSQGTHTISLLYNCQ